jgi:hypothetical protein
MQKIIWIHHKSKEPQWPNGYRVKVPGHIELIMLIICGSLRPSNGTVDRGSLHLVSMQEQVKDRSKK